MRALLRHAAGVAGVAAVLLGPAVGVASAAGGAAAVAHPAAGTRAVSGGAWGKAEEVPGTAALNQGQNAGIGSVSCASPGNCSAGGSYSDSSGHVQAFVVSQVNGRWVKAEEVPGTAALNTGGSAGTFSVSCGSAGNCSAGGTYTDKSGHHQAFVVSQVNGKWGKAEEVPGTAALNKAGDAGTFSVSCASAGNCSAGGDYRASPVLASSEAFVVSQVNGKWGKAEEVPGTAALNKEGGGETDTVSCASAGNCSAGGAYSDSNGHHQAFVVSQVHGRWGKAEQVPGTPVLEGGGTFGGHAFMSSVSCASAGNCSAGGYYIDDATGGQYQVFVITQVHGRWGKAEQVPGTAALNKGGFAQLGSVSCGSAGNCSAGGQYSPSRDHYQAFVVSQVNGKWGKAEEVPGTATLNRGGFAVIGSVSCASAGNCSAGGYYTDSSKHGQAFVVSRANGAWGKAEEVPGTSTLNKGGFAAIGSVSCASPGQCSAGGQYSPSSGHTQAFVVSQA